MRGFLSFFSKNGRKPRIICIFTHYFEKGCYMIYYPEFDFSLKILRFSCVLCKEHFSAWKHVDFMFYQVLCKKGKIHAKFSFLLENTLFLAYFLQKGEKRRKNKDFAKKILFSEMLCNLLEKLLKPSFTWFSIIFQQKWKKSTYNMHFCT